MGRHCVRSPRVSEGSPREHLAWGAVEGDFPKLALPHGRASDTLSLSILGSSLKSALLLICIAFSFHPITLLAQRRATATITIDTSHPASRFIPSHALGAAIDGHEKGVNDLQLTPP